MGRPRGSKNKKVSRAYRHATLIELSYIATIKILGKIYEASGTTAQEAITNLKPDGIARGMSIITVAHGEQKQEKILPKLITMRLFSKSPMMREIAIRTVTGRFSI